MLNTIETSLSVKAHQLGAVVGSWLFSRPVESDEQYTINQWNQALNKVRGEWFGEGVKNEDVANILGAFGRIIHALKIDVVGEFFAKNKVARGAVVGMVGAGLGLAAYDQAFGSGADHVLAMGDHGIDKNVNNADTPIVMIKTIPEHHLVIDEKVKDPSFFIVDQESVVNTIDATRIVENYGLADVDRVVSKKYNDPTLPESQRILIEKVVGAVNAQSATGEILAVNSEMAAIQLQDTHLTTVNSLEVGRRGGMKYVVDNEVNIVVGLSTTGQLFAVFGATPEGDLTGLVSGDEGLAISPLVWGDGESSGSLGIYIDGKFVTVFDEAGKVELHSNDVDGSLVDAKFVPGFLTGYESPDLVSLREKIGTESGGKYAVVDEGGVWSSETSELVPGLNVDKNGKMWMTLPSGERLIIDAKDVSFDDQGKMNIAGYKLENSMWVEFSLIESPVGQATKEVLVGLNVPLESLNYEIVNGIFTCTEKSTGDVVCEDGVLTLDFLQEVLSETSLVGGPTQTPNPNSGRPNQAPNGSDIKDFSVKLVALFRSTYLEVTGQDSRITGDRQNGRIERILIGEDKWAVAVGEKIDGNVIFNYLIFEPSGKPGEVRWFPILPVPANQIDSIWADN